VHVEPLPFEGNLFERVRGEYRNRDVRRGRVFAQSLQKLDSAEPRHFQIEQDELGQGVVAFAKSGLSKNEVERFNAIGESQYLLGDANSA